MEQQETSKFTRTRHSLPTVGQLYEAAIERGDIPRLPDTDDEGYYGIDDLFAAIDKSRNRTRQIREIVPIEEWTRSTYYLGNEANTLYPYWEDVIIEFISSEKNQLIIGGGMRSGKSNTALLTGIRKFYELSCYDPIPGLFGLSASSLILFMYLSLSLQQANMLGMGRMRRMIDQIPYFRENFPRDPKSETLLKFYNPSILMLGGSEMGHFKGGDLFFLIFDEANFTRGAADLKYQNAVDIYRESTIRRKSTFLVDGKEHGVGIIVSSADTQSSFVEKHTEAMKNDPNTMIVHAVAYQVQPHRYQGVGTFPVFIGDDVVDPFLPGQDPASWINFCRVYQIDQEAHRKFDKDWVPEELKRYFYDVPVTFRETFELDIYGALREVCGVSVGQSGRFFLNRAKYNWAFDDTGIHPFAAETIIVSYADSRRLAEFFVPESCEFNPNYEYFGGIDQSLTDDSTGIALCHYDPTSFDLNIKFDFMLRVDPPKKPAKISPEKIVDFFIWLHQEMKVTQLKMRMDTYATQQSIQTLNASHIEAEHGSVDKNWDPYRSFAGGILDGKVTGYHYQIFKDELFALIQDHERKKIDHPPGGTKDVSDAACQAYNCALESWLALKGGIRYFPEFTPDALESFRYHRHTPVYCGIYFGPQIFYCVWVFVTNKGTEEERVRVFSEFADYTSTVDVRISKLRDRQAWFDKDVVYAGDPEGREKSDVSGTSPLRTYRNAGLNLRCRKRLDRYNFEIIKKSFREERLKLNEPELPMLIRSLRKAKYKMRHGIKTGDFDKDGDEFPLIALRVALEEALSKSSGEGY